MFARPRVVGIGESLRDSWSKRWVEGCVGSRLLHEGLLDLMADSLSPEERSQRMSLVRGKDTKPEMIIRSLLHRSGYRYRLHVRDLPGSPDLVFPSRKKVVFVHGCFWHRHACRLGARLPKSRVGFWRSKLEANRRRDLRTRRRLRRAGWRVLVIWECQIQKWTAERMLAKLRSFLDD